MVEARKKKITGRHTRETTLKTAPVVSFAHLFRNVRGKKELEAEIIIMSPLQYLEGKQWTIDVDSIDLARCKDEKSPSKIYITTSDLNEFSEITESTFTTILDRYKGTSMPKLYDMLTDKLYETKFKEKLLVFKTSELAKLTDQSIKHADRIKERYLRAAQLLWAQTIVVKTPKKEIQFKLFQGVEKDSINGGFAVCMTDYAMDIFSHAAIAQHDTVLYTLKDNDECVYSIGRWIEDFSVRHSKQNENNLKEVVFTVKAIMECCSFVPEYLLDSREYAHRMPWIESKLKKLKEIGFMDWEWVDGRPSSIEQEAVKKIRCRFAKEREPMGPATKAITNDRPTKKAIKANKTTPRTKSKDL